MTSDDQQFLDTLTSIPTHLYTHSASLANSITNVLLNITERFESSTDTAALQLRETLSSATWLPPNLRPTPPPQSIASRITTAVVPRGIWGRSKDLMLEHRALTAACIAFTVTGAGCYIYQRREYLRKRRARKLKGGGRKDVVVVVGSPELPMSKSIILDLDYRGFQVYLISTNPYEEESIQHLKRDTHVQLRLLDLDITNPNQCSRQVRDFTRQFHQITNGQELKGVIIIPQSNYPTGALETIPPELWSETLQTRILYPILTTQALLPALQTLTATIPIAQTRQHSLINLFQTYIPTSLQSNTNKRRRPRLLFLTSNTTSSLSLPRHTPCTTASNALKGFIASLTNEVSHSGIEVTHIETGLFSFPSSYTTYQKVSAREGSGSNGTSHRVLNNTIFDLLTSTSDVSGIRRVGKGALTYEIMGKWMPGSLVAWMVGDSWGLGQNQSQSDEGESPGRKLLEYNTDSGRRQRRAGDGRNYGVDDGEEEEERDDQSDGSEGIERGSTSGRWERVERIH